MASTPAPDATTQTTGPDPLLIAHRGFAGVHPENTVAAVERAVEGPDHRAADAVEIDVMPSATGEVVVFHDTSPARVTDAPATLADRPIWDLPYERLAGLDVLASGEPVPRLADVLSVVPSDVPVNVEFKNPGSADVRIGQSLEDSAFERHRRRWAQFAESVLAITDDFPHEILVSSFHEPAIAGLRAVDPSVATSFVFHDSIARGLAVARRYDCESVHLPMNMIAGTELFDAGAYGDELDRDLVTVAHEEGRDVTAWTIQNWFQASQLRRAGVDGIITDYPGVLSF